MRSKSNLCFAVKDQNFLEFVFFTQVFDFKSLQVGHIAIPSQAMGVVVEKIKHFFGSNSREIARRFEATKRRTTDIRVEN
jgi:K+-transporting ATPase c subunit